MRISIASGRGTSGTPAAPAGWEAQHGEVHEADQGFGVNARRRRQDLLSRAFLLDVGLDGGSVAMDLAQQGHGEAFAALGEEEDGPERGVGHATQVPAAVAGPALAAALGPKPGEEIRRGDVQEGATVAFAAGAAVDGVGDPSEHHG